nr:MAG TPA: putative tail component [Caudoviricetes sp.]
MANNVEFRDCSISVKAAINDTLIAALYEAAGAVVSQTAKNTRVDTGQTKNSWSYTVDESEGKATIGSPLENAIWEEFGTGVQALNGDGRKTAWRYQDEKDHWHITTGKKGTRAFYKAFNKLKTPIIKLFESKMKELK